MLNQNQIDALAVVAGRALTPAELVVLEPLVCARNDVEIAAILSVGRTAYGATQIGEGTVVAVMDPRGGLFLDAVVELGQVDRDVHWGMAPVRRGVLDLSVPAARASLIALRSKLPNYAAEIDKLLQVGVVPDPIDFNVVSDALNNAEGRMTL
ncbi:hypothetical protein [Massilia brevitalea]|uniref:hypothetical protein n=1 Tax=Massilia brevitalea TaxID=442526 RepID=UPI00273A4173|nr:hypothetical protein [Massilia brevitalea]